MSEETKDLIQKNIETRAKKDFEDFKAQVLELASNYFPSKREQYSREIQLTGEENSVFRDFFKNLEPVAKASLLKKREKEFNSILTNLGSYLE